MDSSAEDYHIKVLYRSLERLLLRNWRKAYEKSGKVSTAVYMDKKVTADSICFVSDDMIAMVSNGDSCLYLVEPTLDGVWITGAVQEFSRQNRPFYCQTALPLVKK